MCFVLLVYFICTESHIIRFLIRLAKFLNLKKEGSSFAGRVVEPVLRLLNENALVAVWSTLFILMAYIFVLNHSIVICVIISLSAGRSN
jgi:hypothetical protein